MDSKPNQPPPAEGARLEWGVIPAHIRAAVAEWLGGPVASAATQSTGFSPGVAARLAAENGRRVFLKAIGPEPNPGAPAFHRREARITALLPPKAPVPRLLWTFDDEDDSGWMVLVFEDVDGKTPAQPWRADELARVMEALAALTDALTPSPLAPGSIPTASERVRDQISGWRRLQTDQTGLVDRLDAWSARNLDALARYEDSAAEAVAGDTLLHFDIRADNMLLTPDHVWIVDWPHACVGAGWADVAFFAPSVTMQGGPPPEDVIAMHPACRNADPDALTAGLVALAGFFIYHSLQPPPPGLPTLRPFQAAQGEVTRQWIAARTGWR